MQYPSDAITSSIDTTGVAGTTCGTLVSSSSTTQTILSGYIVIEQDLNNATIKIGSAPYLQTEKKTKAPSIQAPVVFTNQAITCTRANGEDAQFTVVYLKRNIFTTQEPGSASSTILTSNGFTRGELLNGFLILAILLVVSYSFLFHWVRGYRIRQ